MQITARQLQWGLGGCLVLISAVSLATLMSSSPAKVAPEKTAPDARLWVELQEFLRNCERAWNPRDRERLLEAKRPRAKALAPAFAHLLGDVPTHDLAATCLRVLGRFELVDLRSEVDHLVWEGPAHLRPVAVRTADALQPWHIEDLVYLMQEDDPEVRVAAYEIAFRNPHAPWPLLFERLLAEPPPVRRAVQESLPDTLPEAAVDALASALQEAGARVAVSLIAELGRGPRTPQVQSVLLRCLQHGDPEVLAAALHALRARPRPLADPLPVWRVVKDARWPDHLRATALDYLERTKGYDAGLLRSTASVLPPRTRYHAARCLLRAGDRTGLDLLVELLYEEGELQTSESGTMTLPSDEERHAVAQASRRLLSWLSGLSPNTPRDEFGYWATSGSGDWNGRHLPAMPLPAPAPNR